MLQGADNPGSSVMAAVTPATTPILSSVSPNSSSNFSTSTPHQRSPGRVKQAAKAVAGLFIGCLTPPENEDDESYLRKRHRFHPHKSPPAGSSDSKSDEEKKCGKFIPYIPNRESVGNLNLTMAQIYKATRGLSISLKVGQGGFGTVYRGTLEDGSVVAIKRAKKSDFGDHLGAEFHNEIRTLAQVEHLHLVKLYGSLEDGDEQILVVEYVPNGTLREHLDGKRGNGLSMAARLDIAIDVAHAITYLHMYTDKPIIHRDIKSSNVLLNERCRAKVADFGFAREAADRDSGCTFVHTQVRGTAGYLDPEYIKTNHLTVKSDVYSFGALLVELVTGRRPIEAGRVKEERLTTRWAFSKFTKGDAASTMDPGLEANAANAAALEEILELAFKCLAPERHNRPTMQQCAEALWSIRKFYNETSASETMFMSPTSSNSNSLEKPDSLYSA